MKKKIYIFLMLLAVPLLSFSQTDETACLNSFHSLVHKSLSDLSRDSINVSSDKIRIVFELYVSECGKIDSVSILNGSLQKHGICDSIITSSIIGNFFPCLREYYISKNGLLPEKIIIIYNRKFFENGNSSK